MFNFVAFYNECRDISDELLIVCLVVTLTVYSFASTMQIIKNFCGSQCQIHAFVSAKNMYNE